ncbi:insulin-like growth factor-binding protein 7 [Amphibalanus amphitrite]|uniref:insulin-like growth factor-binding protein 7 n=1 Tax=Amphibalanus amphitrite TaxID=1232801 RepID=UPI001C91376D|nr:insulin-like growth factor-binding protein 7 [Amphibalanus amphitrite]
MHWTRPGSALLLPLWLLMVLTVMVVPPVCGLRCLPCSHPDSPPCTDATEAQCAPLGRQKLPCGCCFVCRNNAGERCGGSWGMFGQCGTGMACTNGRCRLPKPQLVPLKPLKPDVCKETTPGATGSTFSCIGRENLH